MLAKQKNNNKSAMPRPSTYRLLRETGTVEEKRVWVLDLMAKRKREGRQWGVRHLDLAWTGLRVRSWSTEGRASGILYRLGA